MLAKGGFVYITTNSSNRIFYTGVTSDINYRLEQRRNDIFPNSFTSRYGLYKLVYCEVFESIEDAIKREKEIKGWRKERKLSLIISVNPEFKDLSDNYKDFAL